MTLYTSEDIAAAVRSYTATLFWTGLYYDTPDAEPELLDKYRDIEDIPEDILDTLAYEVRNFHDLLLEELTDDQLAYVRDNIDPNQFGHDLALTANRHGAGFWDRGHPQDVDDKLTHWARSMGEATLTAYGNDPITYN